MNSLHSMSFLRRALALDAVSTAAVGLALLVFTDLLAQVLQLPASLLIEVGIFLLPGGLLVAFLASRIEPPRGAVWCLIAVNILWAVDSVLLLFTGWVAPNALGHAFIIGQALAVLLFANLEYLGLRRSVALAR